MTDISEIETLIGAPALIFALVFLRVGAAASFIPGFGERSVPVRVKLVFALALALPVAGTLPFSPADVPGHGWMAVILAESVTGAFMGLCLRLFLIAAQTAGAIAAQATSLAQIAPGAFPDPLPAIGQLLTMAALALAFVTGLHVKAVLFLAGSYAMIPVGQVPLPADLAQAGIARIGASFALALQLAAPFAILSVIYNLVLGAINRAMPQLMVAFVGAPFITWGSLALLLLSAPVLLTVWGMALDAFLANPFAGP